jgi:hypothetical protein
VFNFPQHDVERTLITLVESGSLFGHWVSHLNQVSTLTILLSLHSVIIFFVHQKSIPMIQNITTSFPIYMYVIVLLKFHSLAIFYT